MPTATFERLATTLRKATDAKPERIERLRLVAGVAGFVLLAAAAFVGSLRSPANWRIEIAAARRSWLVVSDRWMLAGICAFGVALRLAYLNQPMAYDESYTYTNFASRPLWEAIADYNNTNNHLLHTAGVWLSTRLFGNHPWTIRLPALLAGCLLIPLTYAWCRLRFGATNQFASVPWLAAFLVAVAPALVDYSVNGRGYTMLAVAAIAFDTCLLLSTRGSALAHLGMTGALAGGIATMPLMVVPLCGSLGGFLATGSRPIARQVLAIGIGGLAGAAWYAPGYVLLGMAIGQNTFPKPATFNAWIDELRTALGQTGAFMGEAWPVAWTSLAAIFVGLTFVRGERAVGIRYWLGFACGVMAPLVVLRSGVVPRFFLFAAPWWFALAAVPLSVAIGKIPAQFRPAVVYGLFALATGGALYYFEQPILREPSQRVPGIERAQQVAAAVTASRITLAKRYLAPLPADHPLIYYFDRMGFPNRVNHKLKLGETVAMLALDGQSVDQTLQNPSIAPVISGVRFSEWKRRQGLGEPELYEATVISAP